MKHPCKEDLVGFLYKELAPEQQSATARHVDQCDACRAQLESWQDTRKEMAAWTLPKAERRRKSVVDLPIWSLTVKWAAAAVIFIGAGFGLARFLAPDMPDMASIQAGLRHELRQELRAELARFDALQAERYQAFQEVFSEVVGQLETKRMIDYANLRRDMETMAVLAQIELQNTRRNLVRLASFEPAND